MEVRRQVRLRRSPLNHRRENSIHRLAEEQARPTTTELLLLGKANTELDESPVEERIACIDAEGRRRLVRGFERELIKGLRNPFNVCLALRLDRTSTCRGVRLPAVPK